MSTTAVGRPFGISVVAIIAIVQGVIALVAGIGLVIERNDDDLLAHLDVSSGSVGTYGWLAIIWGVLALLVGFALWGGAEWARVVVAVLEVLHLAGGIYLLFAWSGTFLWQGIWQILVAALILWLLFNPRADEFFAGRRAAA
jgi:hypothetical protein